MRINPKRLWRDVQETTNRSERLDRVRQALARVRPELEALRQEAKDLEIAQKGFAGHPGLEPGAVWEAARLRRFAALLLILDIPVQYLLNSAALPGVAGWKVALGSVALPLALAGAIQHLGEPVLYDRDRPARSIRLAKWLAAGSFLAVALGATVFLFARQASGDVAGYLVTLTSVALWTVAEALPLTAGFVGVWAHMVLKPALEAKRLQMVKAEQAALERLEERLLKEEGTIEPPKLVSRDLASPPERTVPRLTPILLLLLSVLGPGAAATAGQEPEGRLCALMVDRSLSVDPGHRVAALHLVSEQLGEFPAPLGCGTLLVGSFADEGPFAPRRALAVPRQPSTTDCENASPATPVGTKAVLAGVRGFQDHFRRQAVEACRTAEAERRVAFETEERRFLKAARATLVAPQLDRITATDILGVVESLVTSGAEVVFLLTDGIDTAHGEIPALGLASGVHVVLILVPAAQAYGGRGATEHAAQTWRVAGAQTVPYTAVVAPEAWARLGKGTP